jgi:hypothetical protein
MACVARRDRHAGRSRKASPIVAFPTSIAGGKAQLVANGTKLKLQEGGTGLNDPWNLESLPHQGRHTTAYHNFVLAQVRKADREAKGDRKKFLALIETYVKAPVRAHPEMVRMK